MKFCRFPSMYAIAGITLASWLAAFGCRNPITGGGGGNAPAAPSDFHAAALSSSQIELFWIDNSDDEDDFLIERSLTGGAPWSSLTAAADSEFYTDSGLEEDSTYYYRLCARNSAGSSTKVLANAETQSGPPVPAAPDNLSGYPLSKTSVHLSWTDNSTDETGFQVECKPPGETAWSVVTTTAADVTTYDDSGLQTGLSHFYRVCAVNGIGASTYSNEVRIEPRDTYTLTILTNPPGSGTVSADPDRSVYTYETYVDLVALPASGYSFTSFSGYALGDYNPLRFSMPMSNVVVTANFAAINPELAAPTGVQATKGTSTHQITVSWEAVSGTGVIWYNIYRSLTNDSNLSMKINGTMLGEPSYVDDWAGWGANYYYFVAAANIDGEGPRSDTDTYGYLKMLQPLNVKVVDHAYGGTYGVYVTWIGVMGADHYRVYIDGTGHDTANNFAYAYLNAIDGSPHTYQVSAFGANGAEGDLSEGFNFAASP